MDKYEELAEKQKQLQREMQEVNKQMEELRAKEQQEQAQLYLRHVEVLLDFFPEHSRTSCSDDSLSNTYRGKCARCVLLEAKRDNFWDLDFEVEVNVCYRGERQ